MGLSISHDAWHSAYGTFSWWRTAIAKAAGIGTKRVPSYEGQPEEHWQEYPNVNYEEYPEHNFYGKWDRGTEPEDPLYHLFIHSDCEGKINRKYLGKIIARLEEILPNIPDAPDPDYGGRNWYPMTEQFLKGAREAQEARHHLIFG